MRRGARLFAKFLLTVWPILPAFVSLVCVVARADDFADHQRPGRWQHLHAGTSTITTYMSLLNGSGVFTDLETTTRTCLPIKPTHTSID